MRNLIFSFTFILLFTANFSFSEENYLDPYQAAKEEAAAWRDYYENDLPGLVQHLSHLAIIEFRLNQMTAWTTVIPQLLEAAVIFKRLPKNTTQDIYDSKVLPHLAKAYESIREALQGTWNPHQAAKEELAWWIYRRHKNTDNPEIVGAKIADLYRLIYGENDQDHFARAGYLRAVAAKYRDLTQHGWPPIGEADWSIIENLLILSYQELLLGIHANGSLH